MASLSRVQRYCLVLVLFIWSVSLDTIPVEGLQTPIFTAELPKAACAGVATSHVGKGAKYVVNGTMVSVHPEVSPGVYEQEAKLVVLVQNFTENIRGPVGASVCNTNLRKVTDLDLNDCDCAESPYLTQVGDWSESGVLFSFSNCSAQPNVSILVSFGVPDKDYSEVFDTMVPGSTADNFTYFHPYVIVLQPNKNSFSGSVDPDRFLRCGGGAKLSMKVENWQWSPAHLSQNTFLGARTMYFVAPNSDGAVNLTSTPEVANIRIKIGTFEFLLRMERGVIFDGMPSLAGANAINDENFTLPTIQGLWTGMENGVGFCSSADYPYPKWTTVEYDPSIVALFSPTEPTQNPSSPSKTNRDWVIPVAVVVPVVIILVVIIILLVVFVPSVRFFFRPFSKPRSPSHLTGERSTNGNTWHAANKPPVTQ